MKIKPFLDPGELPLGADAKPTTDGSKCPAKLCGCTGRVEIAGICRSCYQTITAAMERGSRDNLPGAR